MKRELKDPVHVAMSSEKLGNRDLPDEEGTESNQAARVQLFGISNRDLPDEEGTESYTDEKSRNRGNRVTEIFPMKRELKVKIPRTI